MPALHMDPEQVRQAAEQLEQFAGLIYEGSQALQRRLARLDWQGGGSADFTVRLQQVVRGLRQQAEEARTFSQRIRREVDEWQATDSAGPGHPTSRFGFGPQLAAAGGGVALVGSVLGASTSAGEAYHDAIRGMSWKDRFLEEQRLDAARAASRAHLDAMQDEAEIHSRLEDLDARIADLERRRAGAQSRADAWYNRIRPDWDKEHRPFPGDGDGLPWRTESDDYEDQVSQLDIELQALRSERQNLQAELDACRQEQANLAELQARQSALEGVIAPGIPEDGPSARHPYFPGTDSTNCTRYAARHRNVPCSGNAHQWNDQAAAAGYETGNRPVPGSVLVIEPDPTGRQSHATHGHVAIVDGVDDLGGGSYNVHIREGGWNGGYSERSLTIHTSGASADVRGVPVSFIYDQQR
ncbi:MAG: CHAP domain-containing protein [Anaerolineales bacterium]|nr:CHAP domain-containing protein [Anaerolineales bacterium]